MSINIEFRIIFFSILIIIGGCQDNFVSEEVKKGNITPQWDSYCFYALDNHGEKTTDLSYVVTATKWTESLTIVSSFEEVDITINSDTEEKWLTCERLDDSKFILQASYYNNALSRRHGNIRIKPKVTKDQNVSDICIEIEQFGRDITVGQVISNIFYECKAYDRLCVFYKIIGTSPTYEIRADGEYSMSKAEKDSWYSISHSKEQNTFYITTTENNTEKWRTGYVKITLTDLPDGQSLERTYEITQGY